MSNFIIGKREALSNNSTKYGYSLDGLCVKAVGGGYRSKNGTFVDTAVSTDASCITKEVIYMRDLKIGNVAVVNGVPCSVLEVKEINPTTHRFELLNLQSGAIEDKVFDTTDRAVAVLWDTFVYPEKAIIGGVQAPQLNEFTPAQLNELRMGKTTLEALRQPKTTESLEDVFRKMFKAVMAEDTVQG